MYNQIIEKEINNKLTKNSHETNNTNNKITYIETNYTKSNSNITTFNITDCRYLED